MQSSSLDWTHIVKKSIAFFGMVILTSSMPLGVVVRAATFPTTPKNLGFQARLLTTGNTAIPMPFSITTRLYDSSSGGTLLYTDSQTISTSTQYTSDGILSTYVGAGSGGNVNLAFDKQYYLELEISGETLSPRVIVASSGYTYVANTAYGVSAYSSAPTGLGVSDAGKLYYDTTSSQLLAWDGSAWTSVSGSGSASSFASITSGVNMSATMSVGPGATLQAVGGGVVSANQYAASDSLTTSVDLSTSEVAGTLGLGNGGLGFNTSAQGSLVYASAANTLSTLAVGAAGQVLTMVGGVPTWATSPTGMADPMTTAGDITLRDITNTTTRLAVGSAGQVLTVSGGVPTWQTLNLYTDPATTVGDLVVRNASNVSARLPVGSAGQVLTVSGGVPTWQTITPGMTDPMSTAGDLIVRNSSNVTSRLGVGTNGQILTVSGGVPTWQTSTSFVDPMTTVGDVIVRDGSNTTTRLAAGTNGQVLTMSSGVPTWQNSNAGFADPMTTAGDMIVRDGTNTTSRLAIGSEGQIMTVTGGAPVWSNLTTGGTIGAHVNGSTAYGILFTDASGNLVDDSSDFNYDPVNNKLYVQGGIDPVYFSAQGTSSNAYYEAYPGQAAVASAAGTGRLRYNGVTSKWELSANGSAYETILSSSNGWQIGGNTTSGPAVLGTNDNSSLTIATGSGNLNIGTDAVSKNVTLGNTTGNTQVLLQAGTGNVVVGASTLSSTSSLTVQPGGTNTNLTLASNGTGTISINGPVAGSAIDTDPTLAANSDTKIASQKAVKAYISSLSSGQVWRTAAAAFDITNTTKPTVNPVIDGYTIALGDRVLFTALSGGQVADNNKVWKATGSLSSITWTLETDGQAGTGAPTQGDSIFIQHGTQYVSSAFAYSSASGWVVVSSLNGALLSSNNLSDIANASTARTNLGLGTTNTPTFAGLTLNGGVTQSGDLTINTNKFSVSAASGNTVVSGSLDVNGTTSLIGTNNLSGTTVLSGQTFFSNSAGLTLNPYSASSGSTSELHFAELAVNGSNYIGFKAPDNLSANLVWTLPTIAGSAGQVLTTDASGNLSWQNASVSVPLSSVQSAAATNTLSNGNFSQTWNWQLTSTGNALSLGESAASSGTGYLLSLGTLSGSTAKPLKVSAQGATVIDTDSGGNLTLNTNFTQSGSKSFTTGSGTFTANGNALIAGNEAVSGNQSVSGNSTVSGNATLGSSNANRLTINSQILGTGALNFQGATDDGAVTTFDITDPTINRSIVFPDASGTVALKSDIGVTSLNGVSVAAQTFANDTNVTITSSGSTHTLGWVGTLDPSRGGTGQSGYAIGDMLYASAPGTLSKLSAGTNGQVLTLAGGVPTWTNATSGASIYTTDGALSSSRIVTLNSNSLTLAGSSGNINFTASGGAIFGNTVSVIGNTSIGGILATTKGSDLTVPGTLNNLAVTASLYRFTAGGTTTITGFASGSDGKMVTIVNASTSNLVLSNQDTSSSSTNRIITGSGANTTVYPGGAVTVVYDSTSSRWRITSLSTGTSSSPISSWQTTGNAPGVASILGTTDNSALSIQTGSGALNVGADAFAKTITIGNTTGATAINISAGSGNINFGTKVIGAETTNILPAYSAALPSVPSNARGSTVYVGSTDKNYYVGTGGWKMLAGYDDGLGTNFEVPLATTNFDLSTSTGVFSSTSGANTLNGNVTIASGKNFTQVGNGTFTTGSGAVTLGGNTSVSGAGTFTSGTGSVLLQGATTVTNVSGATFAPFGTAAGNTTEARFAELSANGSNYVGFKAPDTLATNSIWTLPTADSAGCLQSNGSGVLSFAGCSGGGGVTSLNGLISGTQTFVNDTNVQLVSAGSTHTLTWNGSLPVTRGGTGLSSVASGSMTYASAANTMSELVAGTNGQVLTMNGGVPTWQNAASGFADPLTSAGDLMIRNGSNITTRLPVGTAGQVLVVSGGVPTWITQNVIPSGTTSGDTLRWDGTAWVSVSNFSNDGTNIATTGDFTQTGAGKVTTGTGGVVLSGQAKFNGVTTDITTGTNEDLIITPDGTGNVKVTTTTATDDQLVFAPATGGTQSNTGTITTQDLTGPRNWNFPNISGTVMLTSSNIPLNQAVDMTASKVLANGTNTLTWGWSSTNSSPFTLTGNALTTGSLLSLTSNSNAIAAGSGGTLLNIKHTGSPASPWSGQLVSMEEDGFSSNLGGSILKVGYLSTNNAAGTSLNVTTGLTGTGALAFKVNDDGTYTDSSPFAVDATGKVGIGTASPTALLTVNGDTTNNSAILLNPYNTTAGSTGETRYAELTANGTNYVGFKSPDSIAANKIWTLPAADGTNGQVLSTNGSGVLSWSSAGQWTTSGSNISYSSGNVGIGVSNPTSLLSLTGTSTNPTAISLNPYNTTNGSTGEIRFAELSANGSNYIGFKSPNNIASNQIWTLPNSDGTNGSVLTTNGSGVLSWAAGSSGSVPTTATTNDTLRWNGTAWVASSIVQNDGTSLNVTGNVTTTGAVSIGGFISAQTLNADLLIAPNGTGGVLISSSAANGDQIKLLSPTGGSQKFTGTLTAADLTAARTWTLPDAGGTILTSTSGITLDAVSSMIGSKTLSNGTNTLNWGWSSSNSNPFTLTADSLTSGSLLTLSSISTGLAASGNNGNLINIKHNGLPAASWTGQLVNVEAAAASSNYNGSVAKFGYTAAASGNGTTLNITTAQSGASALALRVNDDGSYVDSSPFVIDATGKLGLGTASPTAFMTISGDTTNNTALLLNPYSGSSGATGEVRFAELFANGSNYVGFKAADNLAANKIWTLPGADGTSGQVLTTNGSGTLSWATVSGGGGGSSQWTTNGTSVYYNTGNVGIGVSVPTALLSLTGTASNATALLLNPYNSTSGSTGEVRFAELSANGTNYVGFKSPDSLSANKIWTLPSADGISGQVLKTDGSGNLSWGTDQTSAGGGGSSQWIDSAQGIYYTAGNVSIGNSIGQNGTALTITTPAIATNHAIGVLDTNSNVLFDVTATGNVGIGVTGNGTNKLYIKSDGSAGAPLIALGATADTTSGLFHPAAGVLAVSSSGAERLRVNGNGIGVTGNIGIGTNAPGNKLTIQTDGTASVPAISIGTTSDSNTGIYHPAADTLAFTTGGTQRMQLMSTGEVNVPGNFSIGTSTGNGLPLWVSGGATLNISNYAYMRYDGTFDMNVGGTAGALYAARFMNRIAVEGEVNVTSDRRLKDKMFDITPDMALEKLMQLQPVAYQRRLSETEAAPAGAMQEFGFFAQDVQQVLPNTVMSLDDPSMSDGKKLELSYNGIYTIGVAATQKLAQLVGSKVTTLSAQTLDELLTAGDSLSLEQRIGSLVKIAKEQDVRIKTLEDAIQKVSFSSGTTLSISSLDQCAQDGLITLQSDIDFHGHLYANGDTVGTAVVKTGDTTVVVMFVKNYKTVPVVNATLAGKDAEKLDVRYSVSEVTQSGFTISINNAQSVDVSFNWVAIAPSVVVTPAAASPEVVPANPISPSTESSQQASVSTDSTPSSTQASSTALQDNTNPTSTQTETPTIDSSQVNTNSGN